MKYFLYIFILSLGFFGIACGPSRQESAQACEDVSDAVAKFSVRCNQGSFEQAKKDFIKSAACGDCNNILTLKDKSLLYSSCVPMLENAACEKLTEVVLSDACRGQLLRDSNLTLCF